MSRVLPQALPSNGCLGIVSPAGAPKPELVQLGLERLHAIGYRTKVFPSALKRGPIYYAGTAEERAADLHAAFEDPEVDAVLCTRGGWGSAELLPLLDAKRIAAHPKPFLGYSDQTSLQIWLARECGLVSFYAPMVAPDFGRGAALETSVDLKSWRASLQGETHWSLGAVDGLRVLREGNAQGTLFGGCLSIVTESLGTPYAMQPPAGDTILFIEDVGVHPYQWDRFLVHARYADLLNHVRGIVFGDMEQCGSTGEPGGLLEKALLHNLRDFTGPIAIGLRCGHVSGANITLPLGIRASLHATSGNTTLTLEEAAVRL